MDPDRPSPALLILAYQRGLFPMADSATGALEWYSPDPRGIFPLDAFHVPRSLRKLARSGRFRLATDTAFEAVMAECASARRGRERTWIDERLVEAYVGLHRMGVAHSVEAWLGEQLAGGVYGVSLGAAFFGESMFTRFEMPGASGASKVCLVRLVELLRAHGFTLFDTQFSNRHIARFGCVEIRRSRYLALLRDALARTAEWPKPGELS
jgi:leucyl/phenylalanyl-tRNA---protein transferase